MKNTILISLAALALGLAGCGGKDEQSPLDSIPGAEALTLEVTPDDPGLLALGASPAALQPAAATELPTTGDDLLLARERIAGVNEAIRSIFDHVRSVAGSGIPPTVRGTWYGPTVRCTVDVSPCPANASAEFALWVGRSLIPGHGGEFVLVARHPGSTSDADYKGVLAGWMRRGAMARRGFGQIWIDLENLKLAASAFPGQGLLYAGFAAGPVAKAESMLLVDFTPDAGAWEASTVGFRGYKTAAGTRRVRVADVRNDYVSGAGNELALAHVAYNPDLGGRAYGIVSGGDVTAGTYFLGRSCYAAHAPEAPVYKEWFTCSTGVGPLACIAEAGGVGTPVVGSGGWSSCPAIGADEEFEAPVTESTDPGFVPGELPGENLVDITPEPAPTSDAGQPTAG